MSSLEKSIELRSIKKAKEKLNVLYAGKKILKEDLDNRKKILLEDVQFLKEVVDPEDQYEAWLLLDLEKLEKELTEEEVLRENWGNISDKNHDEILEILEKKYRIAYENHDSKEMENALHLIRVTKRKHIDNEIGKNIIEGTCNENVILFNKQIDNITRANR